jgi:putative endonuclease
MGIIHLCYDVIMARDKKIEGELGEQIAEAFLRKKSFKILERNFRTRNGEVDIIALDLGEKPSVLCFIEVKTRKTTDFGTPLEAIHYYKLRALIRTAEFYKLSHRNLPDGMRIDAVSVMLNNDNSLKEIQLVKNIS